MIRCNWHSCTKTTELRPPSLSDVAEVDLTLRFDGPAFDAGRISVRDLAPALLALGEIFHEVNEVANPDGEPIALDITATERGSFDVSLILANPEFVDQAVRLLSSTPMLALATVITFVTGLAAFIKWVRGKQIVATEPGVEPGYTRVTLDNGDTLEIPSEVVALYRKISIRKNLAQLVHPLSREGVEKVELRQMDQEEPVLVVEKADYEPFSDVPPVTESILNSVTRTTLLKIVSPILEGSYQWRFSEGDSTFTAPIHDEAFLERVQSGEEAFRNGDFLVCQVRLVQSVTAEGALRSRHEIERVDRHVPAIQVIEESFPGLGDPGSRPNPPALPSGE